MGVHVTAAEVSGDAEMAEMRRETGRTHTPTCGDERHLPVAFGAWSRTSTGDSDGYLSTWKATSSAASLPLESLSHCPPSSVPFCPRE